jgi:hypothetical protein
MNEPDTHAEHKDLSDARWRGKPPNHKRQRTPELKKHHSPRQVDTQGKAVRLKELAEPTDIVGVQKRIDGVDDENDCHYDPNDIETAARIVRRTTEPASLHKVS